MRATIALVAAVAALVGVSFVLNRGTSTDYGPPRDAKPATLRPGKTAVVRTTKGTFRFVLYQKDMPRTTKNFIRLARKGFYDGTVFHRYEPGFVIQGGQPRKGEKKPRSIRFEYREGLVHKVGAVAMARVSGDYHSANSEFYICLGFAHQVDGHYAVFGQVTSGMEVVQKLRRGDRILNVQIAPTGGATGRQEAK